MRELDWVRRFVSALLLCGGASTALFAQSSYDVPNPFPPYFATNNNVSNVVWVGIQPSGENKYAPYDSVNTAIDQFAQGSNAVLEVYLDPTMCSSSNTTTFTNRSAPAKPLCGGSIPPRASNNFNFRANAGRNYVFTE